MDPLLHPLARVLPFSVDLVQQSRSASIATLPILAGVTCARAALLPEEFFYAVQQPVHLFRCSGER